MTHTTVTSQPTEQKVADKAEQGAEQASPWVERLARLGYITKGIVYIIVGTLAIQAVLGTGGQTTGSSGALQQIVAQPFGKFLLGIVAVGLAGYALWRVVQAIIDADSQGSDAKGIGKRLGYAVSGLLYGGLAWTAAQIVMGSGGGGGGNSTQDWTARLMSQPFGVWLVGIVGAIVIGTGIYQVYKGVTARFREKLHMASMSQRERTWALSAGQFGLSARGVVLGLIGLFLIQAALQTNPNQAKGLGSTLQELAQQPAGPWLLGIVAIGLIAYGIFMAFLGRYRRINVS
jgi:hypothetical protein